MSSSETLLIDLAPDTAKLVQDAVRSGRFPDASAVIDAALLGWDATSDPLLDYDIDELRRLGDEGEASGPGVAADFEEIKREARAHAIGKT